MLLIRLFFNILHPPLNVPALGEPLNYHLQLNAASLFFHSPCPSSFFQTAAVSLDEDVDTNKELVGHGLSNVLAGAFGVVPNYLVYVNTLLFVRVGGTTRASGVLLALATFALLVVGTEPIGYIRQFEQLSSPLVAIVF